MQWYAYDPITLSPYCLRRFWYIILECTLAKCPKSSFRVVLKKIHQQLSTSNSSYSYITTNKKMNMISPLNYTCIVFVFGQNPQFTESKMTSSRWNMQPQNSKLTKVFQQKSGLSSIWILSCLPGKLSTIDGWGHWPCSTPCRYTLLWTCQHAQLSRLLDVMRNMHTLGCTEVSKHKIRIHLDPIYLWEFRCQCKKCWFWHHDGTVGCYVLRLYRQHHSVCCYGFRCPLPSFPVNSQEMIITGTQLTLLYPDHYKEMNISND